MRKVTIQEVIRAVPLNENTKNELLSNYESYDEATKFEIMHACWDAFDDMYDAIKEAKKAELMAEVTAGTRQIGDNFTQTVEEAAWENMEEYISGKKIENEALETVRKQLQDLLKSAPKKDH